MHQIRVHLLAFGAPVGADGFGLFLCWHSEGQIDDSRAFFQNPAAGGIFAISGGVIISRNRELIAQFIIVFFQIIRNLLLYLGRDLFTKNSNVLHPSSVME